MAKCMQCGKKIGSLEGYHHEVYGKRWLFCSKCYNKIGQNDSVIIKKMKEEQKKKEQYN